MHYNVGWKQAFLLLFALQSSLFISVEAQEVIVPLQSRPAAVHAVKQADIQAVTLPFFDDFSARFSLWEEKGGATVDDGDRLFPPTVGVATLDAIDASGNLYSDSPGTIFSADTLSSLPVRLDGYLPSDSLVFSFYYLPGGGEGDLWQRVGDAPDPQDSLLLEFYRPVDSLWVPVWSCGGVTVDSLVDATGLHWQYVSIPIGDPAFFDSLFQFRFRNYCSLTPTSKTGLSGNCDFWHLDYILLDVNRTVPSTPVFRDIAFVSPAPSLLADYRAMPARQYDPSDMATSLNMTIANLFNSPLATQYAYAVLDASGDTLYFYDGGYENAPPFLPGESYQTAEAHAHPSVQFSFPASTRPAEYTVVHTVREGAAGDDYPFNDTVRFRQVFGDYFAYDDGTAENGYGLTSTSSHLYLAYRFDLHSPDTLTALDLYFNRTLDGENEQIPFLITVWKNENGRPGAVLYRDQSRRRPLIEGLNRYRRYVLERPVIVSGSVFVGFEQTNNYYINLGFDRSFNSADRIYYLTSNEWQQSILSGSLMLRPCFGAAAIVGIPAAADASLAIKVSPNPAVEHVAIHGLPDGSRIELYDATGRKVMENRAMGTMEMDVSRWAQGIYLLRCIAPDGTVHTEKLIIRH